MIFEVCATNIASVLAAHRAGAHRIELCAALDSGGVTPSMGLVRAALAASPLPVHVLIRPREGDFCYDKTEIAAMLDDIRFCRQAGVAGVVIGALLPDGRLDIPLLTALKDAARGMTLTCHRAFDFTPDPAEALEQLIDLGFERLLSSGQAASAWEGRYVLGRLVARAAGRITVMPGGGITAGNVRAVVADSGAREFHFTGKAKVIGKSASAIPGLESGHWESDSGILQQIMAEALLAS